MNNLNDLNNEEAAKLAATMEAMSDAGVFKGINKVYRCHTKDLQKIRKKRKKRKRIAKKSRQLNRR